MNIASHFPDVKGSTWRLSNTRTLASLSGMSGVRTRYMLYWRITLSLLTKGPIHVIAVPCQKDSNTYGRHLSLLRVWDTIEYWLITLYCSNYRSGHCGGTTSRTHKALSLLLIAMTEIVLLRQGTNFTECWMRWLLFKRLHSCFSLSVAWVNHVQPSVLG